jgi:hypothetical protein
MGTAQHTGQPVSAPPPAMLVYRPELELRFSITLFGDLVEPSHGLLIILGHLRKHPDNICFDPHQILKKLNSITNLFRIASKKSHESSTLIDIHFSRNEIIFIMCMQA